MALLHLFFMLQTGMTGAERLMLNTGQVLYRNINGTTVRFALFTEGYGPDGMVTRFYKFLDMSDTVAYTFILGNLLAIAFMAQLLYGRAQEQEEGQLQVQVQLQIDTTDEVDTDDTATDEVDTDAEKEVTYEGQYFKQLEDMPETELSPEELAVISQHVLTEDTPKGLVYMMYNADMETFDYYTDKFVEVTYEILDTVARRFAITFRCKQICVNYKAEVIKGERNMLSEMEFDQLKKELAEKNQGNSPNKERSVFASFKKYNKKNGNNVAKKYYIVTEQANRFKYKGKISEYEQQQKKAKESEETKTRGINISYSEFKRLQQE